MSERKINLEEIIKSNSPAIYENQTRRDGWTKNQVKNICLEFGKQLLELAVENAELIKYTDNFGDPAVYLNKQSILDSINQIE